MSSITTVTARNKLRPQREPYWQRVSTGFYVGYRKMSTATSGTWVLRMTDKETGKYVKKTLGALDTFPDHQRFDEAMRAAQDWLEHTQQGGIVKVKTVADVCDNYVTHITTEKGKQAGHETGNRLKRHILRFKRLSETPLARLTPAMVDSWRKELRKSKVLTGPRKGETLSESSVNREMNVFRAALNLAFADGWVTTDFAWRAKLTPIKSAGSRRDNYLNRGERDLMISKGAPDIARFMRALSSLPLRPGAMAHLLVKNYNADLRVLTIGKDKSGKDRRITLPGPTANLFAESCEGKQADDPIFTRADGVAWNKDSWYDPIKDAATAADLPLGTSAYTLRHSVITDLVVAGLDLLTVAQLAGTSVAMIEKHYGHLQKDVATNALAQLA